MKEGMRVKALLWFGFALILTAGCSGSREVIRAQTVGTRPDVFTESSVDATVPPGFADLRITSSVKTHKKGFHLLESGTQGTPDYVLMLNIDGQTEVLRGKMTGENTLDERPRTPDTGDGVRYLFQKVVRLKAGAHNVFLALPEDDVFVAREVRLQDGTRNDLVIEPVYRLAKRFGVRYRNFYSHVIALRTSLNGCACTQAK